MKPASPLPRFLLPLLLCLVTVTVVGDDAVSSIRINSSVRDSIAVFEQKDEWRINVTSAGLLTVATSGDTDMLGVLEDADGNTLAENDDGGSGGNFKIEQSVSAGTYYIRVSGYSIFTTGPYTLHVRHTPYYYGDDTPDDGDDTLATASSIQVNGSANGAISQFGDVDYWRINVASAGLLTVETSGNTNTESALDDADGNILTTDFYRQRKPYSYYENHDIGIVLHVTAGTYYIRVSAYFDDDPGPYTLHVRHIPDDDYNTPTTASSIRVNGDANGAITYLDDVDYWRINVVSTGLLSVDQSRLPTYWALEDGGGNILFTNADRFEWDGIEWLGQAGFYTRSVPVTAGTYYIRVSAFYSNSLGPYALHVIHTPAMVSSIQVNGSANGTLPLSDGPPLSGGQMDYWHINVASAGTLTVEIDGYIAEAMDVSLVDRYGYISQPIISHISYHHDDLTTVVLDFNIDVAGIHYIWVGMPYLDNHDNASYTLRVRHAPDDGDDAPDDGDDAPDDGDDAPATASCIHVNSDVNGDISPAGDVDYWCTNVVSSGLLAVETRGDTDTVGALEDADGNTLAENDDGGSGRNFKIEQSVSAGTYYIRVNGYDDDDTGPYTLRVHHSPDGGNGTSDGGNGTSDGGNGTSDSGNDTPATATSIQVNGTVNGTISPAGDVDSWRINMTSAGLLVVETRGSIDTRGTLEDADGNTLAIDEDGGLGDNFRIEQHVPAGTYYIGVSAHDTGRYALRVRHAAESGSGGGSVPARKESVGQYFGDLNGDGRDDVLLRHTDGRWHYYPMNGPEFLADQRGAAALTSNPDWQFAGIGDLNGDGRDDVLLRRVTDGRWYYYPMNGRQHLADQRGGANIISDLNWQLAGIGDLNGDGKDDVLLRHTDGRWLYYPMDGREYIAGRRATANLTRDLDWQFASIGDFNGDGNDDVLLRHTDGRWHYYPMNGPEFLADQRGAAALTSNLDWQFAGIGDLNGDGKDDVLLRRVTDGRWYYYPMNGRRHLMDQRGGANIISDLNWQLAGMGDLNGDGKDDVLLRHRDDGQWLYYPMDGRDYIAGQRATANLTSDPAWIISGTTATAGPSEPTEPPPDPSEPLPEQPDLVVSTPIADDYNLVSGASLTLTVTVRNRGSVLSDATRLRWYRSPDSRISADEDTEVSDVLLDSLESEDISYQSITLNAPDEPGTYWYGICVDPVTGEGNTANNCSGGVPIGVSTPDLVVSVVELYLEEDVVINKRFLMPGDPLALQVTVANWGTVISEASTLRYYRSLDKHISPADTEVGSDQVESFAAGDTSVETIILSAPDDPGRYWYGACVEPITGESDVGNNCLGSHSIGVGTDLVVDMPTVSKRVLEPGESFTLSTTVRNQGAGNSAPSLLRYYRSTDSNISTSDTQVGTEPVPGLLASDSASASITLAAPAADGRYWYGACVETRAGEGITDNNCSGGVRIVVGKDTFLEMVSIPGGTYRNWGGDTIGWYSRQVPAFRLARFEVTFAQWDACVADGGCGGYSPDDEGWGRGDRPVINVSWNDVQGFIDWLNSKTGGGYRLPSSAEWERAAMANLSFKRFSDALEQAFMQKQENTRTAPVGSFRDNAWRLHDMYGNVLEWTTDCEYLGQNQESCTSGWYSYYLAFDEPPFFESASPEYFDVIILGSGYDDPTSRNNYTGFRLARDK